MDELLSIINKIKSRNDKINVLKSKIPVKFKINDIQCQTGNNCFNTYDLEKIIGKGAFGTVYNACQKKNCEYVVKLQNITDDWYKKIFDMEVNVMNQLMNNKYGGVELLYHAICDGICGSNKIKIGLMILDKWDGNLDGKEILVNKNIDIFLNTISTQIKILHNLGYVHWDLLPKNVLYKDVGGTVSFTITDFGACQRDTLDPYSDEYYNSYYFNPHNYGDIMNINNLNINKWNIKNLTNNYKGIVDYFILYKYIWINKKYDSKITKNEFINLLYRFQQRGKSTLKSHLNI